MEYNIAWTDEARAHIARHGVSEAEVTCVVWSKSYARRVARRAVLIGRSNGRVLLVVLEKSAVKPGAFEVVTARPASESERNLWLRRGKGVR